jgi:hypothetical protein
MPSGSVSSEKAFLIAAIEGVVKPANGQDKASQTGKI